VVTRSGSRNTRLLVVGLVAASLAIITLDYRQGQEGPLAIMGHAAQTFIAPMQEAVTTVTRPVADFFSGLAHLPSLARENRELREQLADAQTQLAGAAEQQRQLQQLYDLLNLQRSLDPPSVPAVVIANGVSNFDWTITINRGSDDGIAVGQPVVTGAEGAPRLVGKVISVTSTSADVQLLIDRGFAVAGRLSTSGETGLVLGQGEQDLALEGIPTSTEFPDEGEAEHVFTVSYEIAGQEGSYPPRILIGEVASVYEASNALETEVTVRPAVDFTALEFVLVLQTPSTEAGA
jgi:rod shape-determining protein MreC